jgi:hypothetical protein
MPGGVEAMPRGIRVSRVLEACVSVISISKTSFSDFLAQATDVTRPAAIVSAACGQFVGAGKEPLVGRVADSPLSVFLSFFLSVCLSVSAQ